MIIGITGKSGSGKSFYSQKLNQKQQYHIIDVDKVVIETLKKEVVKNELIETYGKNIIEKSEINRKKLGEIIFSSEIETKKYNQFIWEYIKKELMTILQMNKEDIIIDWALLPLSEFFGRCDIKILVQADIQTRKKRAMERDNITEAYFMQREKGSLEYQPKDYDLIVSSESLEDLEKIRGIIERRKKV